MSVFCMKLHLGFTGEQRSRCSFHASTVAKKGKKAAGFLLLVLRGFNALSHISENSTK